MSIEPRESCCYSCKRIDFLPIKCANCGHGYCSTHLKSHECSRGGGGKVSAGSSSNYGSGPSFKELSAAVENRFDGMQTGSHREHIRVKTAASANETLPSGPSTAVGTKALETLSKSASKGNSVASKAKSMIQRQKALGDPSIAYEDRVYLLVNFPASGISLGLYFPQHMSLGEMLHKIAQTYPTHCFGNRFTVRPDDKSLTIRPPCGLGSSVGSLDLNAPLLRVFDKSGMDTVDLEEISTKELVARLMKAEAEAKKAAERAAEAERAAQAAIDAANATPLSYPPVDPASVRVGDLLLYVKAGASDKVKISEIHRDDFPNLYFSIVFQDGSGREKQTVPDHLRVIPAPAGGSSVDMAPEYPGSFLILVQHGPNTHQVRVHGSMTVQQVKRSLAEHVPTCTTNSKLIAKGKVLTNDVKCNVLKAGSRLMLLA